MAREGLGTNPSDGETAAAVRKAIEVSIRLGAIAILVGACLMIMAPFLGIVVWALIIAIAAEGPYESFVRWLGGRRALASALVVVVTLAVLIVPAAELSGTMISGAQRIAHDLKEGSVHVPPPAEGVAEWPLVGPRIYATWDLASENLSAALTRFSPQLQAVSKWLLAAAGSAGAGLLQLLASFLIAGVILARGEKRRRAVHRFMSRMAGVERGPELAALAEATVRSVVQGILGVAFVQALMAGGGFMLAGVPAAGLWALLVLVAAVVQLPVALVVIGPVIYAFSAIGGGTAIALAVWCLIVSLIDNVLKPMLFGRGVEVPMLVIFLGAIGGMLTMGIVGLFLGAVVLALGFALFMAWLEDTEFAEDDSARIAGDG